MQPSLYVWETAFEEGFERRLALHMSKPISWATVIKLLKWRQSVFAS